MSLGLGGRGCSRRKSCAGKLPLYTSFLAHRLDLDRLTGEFVAMPTCRVHAQCLSLAALLYDTLANDGDTGSASTVPVFSLVISTLKRQVISRPTLLRVFAQMHEGGVPASDSQSDLHGCHSLDSVVGIVAMAASATVSIVVGMIGTGAGLGVQTAAMEVQWCVSRSMFCRPATNFFPSFSSFS